MPIANGAFSVASARQWNTDATLANACTCSWSKKFRASAPNVRVVSELQTMFATGKRVRAQPAIAWSPQRPASEQSRAHRDQRIRTSCQCSTFAVAARRSRDASV